MSFGIDNILPKKTPKSLDEINAEKIERLKEEIKQLYQWAEWHEEKFHGRILKKET